MESRHVISHDLSEVTFGVYKEEEILKLSVVRIVTPVTYDRLGNPLPGGLYDPAMGPLDGRTACVTCGLTMRDCPGHMGHLPLTLQVFNPMTFMTLHQILRLKCFKCHGFRLTRLPCRVLAAKLMLIDSGAFEEAERFDEQYFLAENKDALLSRHENRMSTTPAADWTSAEGKAVRKGLIKAFISEVLACRVCDRCGMVKTAVRKDGYTKFFVKERQGWGQQKSALQQVQGREALGEDALESASEAEEDDEEEEGLADGKPNRTKSGGGGKGPRTKDKYMAPVEVQMHLKLLWEEEPVLSTLLWGRSYGGSQRMVGLGNKEAWRLFFWRVLPIPPSRFRPAAKNDDGSMAEHAQNYNIIKIMNHDQKVRSILSNAAAVESQEEEAADSPVGGLSPEDTAKVLSTWIDLQNAVNAYIDSSKDANAKMTTADKQTPGIRQGLEKKEGLFRMHMMGKRVNFACRSVISPDPYIGTSEIGLPLRFAQVLTYPQAVTAWNVVALRKLVENGPSSYPGANFVEDSQGRLVDLRKMASQKRKALAARLLTPPGQKVWRQLQDGDVVLMNRQVRWRCACCSQGVFPIRDPVMQKLNHSTLKTVRSLWYYTKFHTEDYHPTLHKPGIMAHHARVLRNPSAQTIRMHYANCNTYNADFDGDEMNCHLPQDELSRAEAELIACTNEQYIVPTNGKPLRGLIQDHVCSGVKLTSKDCFLTEDEFQQLVYVTLSGLPRVEIVPPEGRIDMPPPTIWKPRGLWTGKQVVSTILRHLTVRLPPLNLDFKAKTPPSAFGADQEEHEVLFRGGELLRGVLDKAAFGASEGGLVHGVYEFYGPHFAGKLLTALGRLFTVYLQFAGHTCGIEDLVLTKEADRRRKHLISRAGALGALAMQSHTSGHSFSPPPSSEPVEPPDKDVIDTVRDKTAALYEEDMRTGTVTQGASIDNFMRTVLSPLSSEVIKACLPDGLDKPFPHNAFGLMVSTGAKGSTVNQSQVSCGLGQQELEGRRVPLMPSGKSLPSFPPYDPTPRAGGYITDRFLTGIRPQEYYFHCMAGREGLIDTAVKTSRSGYLQRCLVKGLEELRVHYDHTVRDGDARVVQFLYGEDGIDPIHSKYLDGKPVQTTALARNFEALVHKYGVDHGFLDRTGMDLSTAHAWHKDVEKATTGEQQSALGVGSFVHAKRLKRGRDQWISGLWKEGWEPAEIIKVHKPKPHRPYPTYDLRYRDGSVAKRVPGTVDAPPQTTNEGIAIYNKSAKKVVMIKPAVPDPVLARACLGTHLGAVSERFQAAIDTYVRQDPERLVADGHLTEEGLQLLLWLKYLRSLAAPGEAVGAIAAQSIGEPSTQMTLNTFHLAGHGGANVTLGIPRMREIIMSASQNIKTPAMTVSFRPGVTREQATRVASRLRTLRFSELIHHEAGGVEVTERLVKSDYGPYIRLYEVRLRLYEEDAIQQTFGLSYADLYDVAKRVLLLRMLAAMSAELRKFSSSSDDITVGAGRKRKSKANDEYAAGQPTEEADEVELDLENVGKSKPKGGDDMGDEDEDEEENEDEDEAQGTLKFGRRQEDVEYEADEPEEEDEQDIAEEAAGATPQAEGGENADAEAGTDAASKAITMDVDGEKVAEGETKLDLAGTESTGKGRSKKGKASKTSAVTTEVLPSSIADNAYFKDVDMNLETGVLTVTLKTVASCRRLLMVNVVEASLEKTVILATNGIQQAYVVEGQGSGGGLKLQTEGCNFEEVWNGADKHLDLNSIMSNDIWRVHQTYGVEAARATIVNEISGVFGVYGIAVDPRHLGLVADFMTYRGGFRALNRNGMSQSSSPFLQMSFETTANFLMEAALAAEKDKLVTPSAKLVVGQPTGNGTGSFSLMVPIPDMPIKRH